MSLWAPLGIVALSSWCHCVTPTAPSAVLVVLVAQTPAPVVEAPAVVPPPPPVVVPPVVVVDPPKAPERGPTRGDTDYDTPPEPAPCVPGGECRR